MKNYTNLRNQIIKYLNKKINGQGFDDLKINYNFDLKIKHLISLFIANYIGYFINENILLKVVDLSIVDHRINNSIKLTTYINENNTNFITENINKVNYIDNIDFCNKILSKLDPKEQKNLLNKVLVNYFYQLFNNFKDIADFDSFITYLALDDNILDALSIVDTLDITPLDNPKKFDLSFMDKKIDEIISKLDISNEKKYISILKKSTEILKKASFESVEASKDLVNIAIKDSKDDLKNGLLKEIKNINNKNYYKLENIINENDNQGIDFSLRNEPYIIKELCHKLNNSISQDYKEQLIDLMNDIDDSLYLNKKNPLDYLLETKYKFIKAINEENKENIIKYYERYNEIEKRIDRIIFRIDSINHNDHMLFPIDNLKNDYLPYKYRYDPVSISRFNGILKIKDFINDQNINFSDFLDYPIDLLIEFLKRTFENSPIKEYFKDLSFNPLNIIIDLETSDDTFIKNYTNNAFKNIDQYLDIISYILLMSPDDNYKNILDFMLLKESLINNFKNMINDIPYNVYKKSKIEYIKNIIVNDFYKNNIYDINPRIKDYINIDTFDYYNDSFNRIRFIKNNNNLDLIIEKIENLKIDFSKIKNDQILKLVNNATNELINELTTVYKNNQSFAYIVEYFKKNKKIDKDFYFSLKKELDFNYLYINKNINECVNDLLDILYELKDKYNNKSISAKMFDVGTKLYKKIIKEFTIKLNNKEINNKYINKYLKIKSKERK